MKKRTEKNRIWRGLWRTRRCVTASAVEAVSCGGVKRGQPSKDLLNVKTGTMDRGYTANVGGPNTARRQK